MRLDDIEACPRSYRGGEHHRDRREDCRGGRAMVADAPLDALLRLLTLLEK